ncbi:MAG: queuosine precursor transporter [Candidatus Limimorpha sp.]
MNKVSENPLKNREAQPTGKLPSLVIIVGLLVTSYLTANVMAVKLIQVFGITIFDTGTIIFPFAYMLGDVLTEIWGFKTAKKVIWLTFLCQVIFVTFTYIGIRLPYPPETSETAAAYALLFGFVPRIMAASLTAFLCGELINAWTMVKIKERTGEQKLWVRTIGSSVFGYIVDTTLFVCIAFIGTVPTKDILSMIWIQVLAKLLIEAIGGTPLAYAAIGYLKRKTQAGENI